MLFTWMSASRTTTALTLIQRVWLALVLAGALALGPSVAPAAAQTRVRPARQSVVALPERAVRRDIPITNAIRRAFAAGTRDSTGRPGAKYWQLRTDYRIDARLDPVTSTVSGRERIVIHNPGDSALTYIALRLDQNIFAPTAMRLREMRELTEGMQLTRVTINGQVVDSQVLGGQRSAGWWVNPPSPIAPKDSGTLEIDWRFQVAVTSMRMGRWGDTLFQVAQWYPRVAVYDDLNGWDPEPYLGGAEFYNNFGRFDVRLDVPAGWLVGATGVLQNPDQVLAPAVRERLAAVLTSDSVQTIVAAGQTSQATAPSDGAGARAGGRLVWHFVADSVADFAWAASDRYVWQATRVTIPEAGTIPFHLFFLPGDSAKFADAARVGRHALEFYSTLWMPYAFPQLTMVDGPEQGMEYPMLVMSDVTAEDHEIGHQWWPMMVGNNETWYGWMDEGFNKYMNRLSNADARGEAPVFDMVGQSYGQTTGMENEPPLMWNANYAGPMYVFQTYVKTREMLSMLGGVVGDSAVWRAMSAYAKAWRFKHPSPWDYAFFMNKALGQDLGWFWYYWLFTTESVDGSIEKVATRGGRTLVTVRQSGQMPSPVVLQVRFAPKGPAIKTMANGRLADSVTAVVTYPVDVWFAGARTFTAALDFGGRKIEQITLDPQGRFPDRDPDDNVWPRAAASR